MSRTNSLAQAGALCIKAYTLNPLQQYGVWKITEKVSFNIAKMLFLPFTRTFIERNFLWGLYPSWVLEPVSVIYPSSLPPLFSLRRIFAEKTQKIVTFSFCVHCSVTYSDPTQIEENEKRCLDICSKFTKLTKIWIFAQKIFFHIGAFGILNFCCLDCSYANG